MKPDKQIQQMLEMDNAGDKQWLNWLESMYKRHLQAKEDAHTIEVARQSELKSRLSNIPGHINNVDEIYIEDLLP